MVILSGRLAIADHQAKTERELSTGGHGDFIAELSCSPVSACSPPRWSPSEIHPGDPVVIAGRGNSPGQAAIWLAGRGHPVTMAVRGADLAENMSEYLIDRIVDRPDIDVRHHTEVRELGGVLLLERVEVENIATKTRETLRAAALVVLVGAEPHTDWLAGRVVLDASGYVVTGSALGPDTRYQSARTRSLPRPIPA